MPRDGVKAKKAKVNKEATNSIEIIHIVTCSAWKREKMYASIKNMIKYEYEIFAWTLRFMKNVMSFSQSKIHALHPEYSSP